MEDECDSSRSSQNEPNDFEDINSSTFFSLENTKIYIKACENNYKARHISEGNQAINLSVVEEQLKSIVKTHPDKDYSYWNELSRPIMIAYYISIAKKPKAKVLIMFFLQIII
jgi:hypothetical protein